MATRIYTGDKLVAGGDGRSAYQSWLDQGNVGTEEEFLEAMGMVDREYDSSDPDGLGYKILKKNQTFASQVTATNTIYEIRYDFNLSSATVSLPDNCVLKFIGGSISNGTITLSSQVQLSGTGKFLSGDISIDTTNNIYRLNLLDDCNLQMTGTTHGLIFIDSNKEAVITMNGVNSLIPCFRNCKIYKQANLDFINYSGVPQVSRFINCEIESPVFETRTEGKCTISFSVNESTVQDSYNEIAKDNHIVELEGCQIKGQGLWGSIKARDCRFEVTANNIYNYEVLHLVGNSVINGCYFIYNGALTSASGLEDIIDCYTSTHVEISDCVFKNIVAGQLITYKQNRSSSYVIEGQGIIVRGCVFDTCLGTLMMGYNDNSNSDYTTTQASFIKFIDNKVYNCRPPVNPNTIYDGDGLLVFRGGCNNITISGNHIVMAKRNVIVWLQSYTQNVTIADNYIDTTALAGTCFLISPYISSSVSAGTMRNIRVERNILNMCVIGRSQEVFANCKNLSVIGNQVDTALFNNNADSGDFAARYDVCLNDNTLRVGTTIYSDRVEAGSYFTRIRFKYLGSTYLTSGLKMVVWNGTAWVNMDGSALS